jgi:hypothetical protein
MIAKTLSLQHSEDLIILTAPVTASEHMPTTVIALGPDLTVEINPVDDLPARIVCENYPENKARIETILGPKAVAQIEAAKPGGHHISFTPGPGWTLLQNLANRRWDLSWNPLPLDPALLALDLLRAEHQAITLTGELPDPRLAITAYPAAQTLQRLLDIDDIASEYRRQVIEALDASEANTPMNHKDATPYTLPVPIAPEELRAVLDPAPTLPGALATGSPDWRLTGHGPAATAENTIIVQAHPTDPAAITITTHAAPHSAPERTPAYQALITDPATHRTIAATTLRHNPGNNSYVGHTTPRRPVTAADFVDIRHPKNPAAPSIDPFERKKAQITRNAVREHVKSLWAHPEQNYFKSSLAAAAASDNLLKDRSKESPSAGTSYGSARPAPSSITYLPPMTDFALAASSGPIRKEDFQEAGPFGITWSRNSSTAEIHIAVDIHTDLAKEFDLAQVAVVNESTESTWLLILRPFEDGEYLVGDIKVADPSGTVRVGIYPQTVDPYNMPEGLLDFVATSILRSSPAGRDSWRRLCDRLPTAAKLRDLISRSLP